MRNRSGSGIRLDYFQRLVNKCILRYQNPATGLISSREDTQHSWVRDNVYSIMAVWGLSLAYKKTADLDEDRAKAYELENAVVMLMRGLLRSMMMQCDKLEKFKKSQSPQDALHAKYCTRTGQTVVGDLEWGHLQIDATSLYLLTLAQMTSSGLNIIFTLDEVAFVQNLVFYVETAYRTPDYGIWERGDKTNHGLPELNSSSIGMAKAALEAVNELDLFAARGGPASVIHVLPDEAQQCQAILMSMLPRESASKEVDASLLTIIGFPAFAVDDIEVINDTRQYIREKLEGEKGCIRFLRDGYKTPIEDPNRLYYEPSELVQFEKIESQWPLFFALYLLEGLFRNDKEQTETYKKKLDDVLLKTEDGIPLVPELYAVPAELIEEERADPDSQKRVAKGQKPHMWGQSLYILSRLMAENLISPGELDPLNRRQIRDDKPDVVVQVTILAEDANIAHCLAQHGISVETISETYPIQVHPARVLSQIFSRLGKSKRLGLSGRPSGEIGLLATSKLYMLDNKIFAFIPQFLDQQRFYVGLDTKFLIDFLRTDVAFLKHSWNALGRPLITFVVTHSLMDHSQTLPAALIGTLKKLQSGYISGTRVHMGKLSEFLTTSCMTQLDFLRDQDDPNQKAGQLMDFIDTIMLPSCPRPHLLTTAKRSRRSRSFSSKGVSGIVRRSRSIQIDTDQIPDLLSSLSSARHRAATLPHSGYGTAYSAATSTGFDFQAKLPIIQTSNETSSSDPMILEPVVELLNSDMPGNRTSVNKLEPISESLSGDMPGNRTSVNKLEPISESLSDNNQQPLLPMPETIVKDMSCESKLTIWPMPEPIVEPLIMYRDTYGCHDLTSPEEHSGSMIALAGSYQGSPPVSLDSASPSASRDGYDTKAFGMETLSQAPDIFPGGAKLAVVMNSWVTAPWYDLKKDTAFEVSGSLSNTRIRNSLDLFDGIHGSDGSSVPGSPLPQMDEVNEGSEDTGHNLSHLRKVTEPHFEVSHSGSHHNNLALPGDDSRVSMEELMENLRQSESLQEQADIIHYMFTHKGPDWDTGMDVHKKCTVRDLLVELYEKAGHWKQWWLVRHTAGMLKKRVEDLAIAATDLVVRQKQLSVGMPPEHEHIITCPLPPDELSRIIFEAYAEDSSSASLTQELLIYLAMFIRTEPKLFREMLRLRVGLIIQVMASEMARTLQCSGEEASDHLLNLSPFEMKTLLHHILSGKEFHISAKPLEAHPSSDHMLTIQSRHTKHEMMEFARMSKKDKVVSQRDLDFIHTAGGEHEDEKDMDDDRHGQWLRRRRLDGALNRVPFGFYPHIWRVLRRCPGLQIDATILYRSLTEEMTEGEFKFALEVEMVLNQLPEPEYRQLAVEAMMVLATMVENDNGHIRMDTVVRVDNIVQEANRIFITEQKIPSEVVSQCLGARGICQHLYDSAPSGRHGTMTYMCRALARILSLPVNNGDIECCVS